MAPPLLELRARGLAAEGAAQDAGAGAGREGCVRAARGPRRGRRGERGLGPGSSRRRAPCAVRPAPCARPRAPPPHLEAFRASAWGAPGGRGGGPRGERRASRSCRRLPLAASAETAPARAARGAARSGGAFLPPRPRDSSDLRAEESGAGPGRTSRERAETVQAGGRRASPALGSALPSPLPPPLALPPHLFFQMLWPPEVRR